MPYVKNLMPTLDSDGKLPAYAWPGGYEIQYYLQDGAWICGQCARGENGSEAKMGHEDPQWNITAWDVYWEGPPKNCDHCHRTMNAEYGDPDEKEKGDD